MTDVVEKSIKLAFERLNASGEIISSDSLKSVYVVMRSHLLADCWITGQPFIPVLGKRYEVNFGLVTRRGMSGYCTALVRVDGQAPANWIDLDTKYAT